MTRVFPKIINGYPLDLQMIEKGIYEWSIKDSQYRTQKETEGVWLLSQKEKGELAYKTIEKDFFKLKDVLAWCVARHYNP